MQVGQNMKNSMLFIHILELQEKDISDGLCKDM